METSNGLSGYGEMFLESNDTDISKTSDSNMNDDILDEYIPSNDSTNPSSQEGQVVKFETKQIEMPNGSESKDVMDDTFFIVVWDMKIVIRHCCLRNPRCLKKSIYYKMAKIRIVQ